jgi:hypothetical protein
MGLLDDAVEAYLLCIYSCTSPRARRFDPNPERARIWLKVANIERTRGHRVLAFRAYLAAAYLDDSLVELVSQGISDSLESRISQHRLPSPAVDINKILRICELYRGMNMHPLALNLIAKVEVILKEVDLSKEKKLTADEWSKIVKAYLNLAGPHRTLYGIEIGKVDDWSKVKILRPRDTFWKPYKVSKKASELPGQESRRKINKGRVSSPGQMPAGTSERTITKGKSTAQIIAILFVSLVAIGGAAMLLVLYLRKRSKEQAK